MKNDNYHFSFMITTKRHIYDIHYALIGWQAYRGDQIHRKTCST